MNECEADIIEHVAMSLRNRVANIRSNAAAAFTLSLSSITRFSAIYKPLSNEHSSVDAFGAVSSTTDRSSKSAHSIPTASPLLLRERVADRKCTAAGDVNK